MYLSKIWLTKTANLINTKISYSDETNMFVCWAEGVTRDTGDRVGVP